MQETQVWSLGREDPLQEEMPTHSSIFAWRIPWIEEHGGLQSIGLQKRWITDHRASECETNLVNVEMKTVRVTVRYNWSFVNLDPKHH